MHCNEFSGTPANRSLNPRLPFIVKKPRQGGRTYFEDVGSQINRMPSSSGGWIGRRLPRKRKLWTLKQCKEAGMRLIPWDGRQALVQLSSPLFLPSNPLEIEIQVTCSPGSGGLHFCRGRWCAGNRRLGRRHFAGRQEHAECAQLRRFMRRFQLQIRSTR